MQPVNDRWACSTRPIDHSFLTAYLRTTTRLLWVNVGKHRALPSTVSPVNDEGSCFIHWDEPTITQCTTGRISAVYQEQTNEMDTITGQ